MAPATFFGSASLLSRVVAAIGRLESMAAARCGRHGSVLGNRVPPESPPVDSEGADVLGDERACEPS